MVSFIIRHEYGEGQPERQQQIAEDVIFIKEMLMALSPEIQQLLDTAAKTKNVVDANTAMFSALQKKTDDLTKQLADALNRPTVTGLSDEDKAGIATTVGELQDMIASAPQNVVAGTGQTSDTNAAPAAPDPTVDASTIAPGTSPAS
jgi:ABC-type Fe3+-hydroxamate transport system substrate-binding protein